MDSGNKYIFIAVSRYYYKNGESFNGLFVAPEYQERFEKLAENAVAYYDE